MSKGDGEACMTWLLRGRIILSTSRLLLYNVDSMCNAPATNPCNPSAYSMVLSSALTPALLPILNVSSISNPSCCPH